MANQAASVDAQIASVSRMVHPERRATEQRRWRIQHRTLWMS
jgi:hypothetical protein